MAETFDDKATWSVEEDAGQGSAPRVPVVLGRWVMGAELGRGAFGRVLEATDAQTGAPVAVKVVGAMGPAAEARLERELRALELLRLPGVVRLIDHFAHQGARYIVMERLPSVPFPGPGRGHWATLQPVARRLFEALAGVHAAGVLHRDLKPQNVLMRGEQPVLLDFGLARGGDLGTTLTRSGTPLGTARYMSPEQAAGRPAGPATDLYAVGVMLFEALSGSLPHAGPHPMALMRARITSPPLRLADAAPGVPDAAARLIDALLQPDPARRPPSARHVVAMLGGRMAAPLPWLGDPAWLESCVAALERGEQVTVSGPRGSGRSRLLHEVAARLPHVWLQPGQEPFSSLGAAAAGVELGAARSAAEARAGGRPSARLAGPCWGPTGGRRAAGSRHRGRVAADPGPWLRVGPDGAGWRIPPLQPAHLAGLFTGPDRVLHLVEDAVTELHRRAGGRARAVEQELLAWERAGLVSREAGRFRCTRAALDQLAAEDPPLRRMPAGGLAARAPLAQAFEDVVAWLDLFGGPTAVADLAHVTGQRAWALDEALEALEAAGLVSRTSDTVAPTGALEPAVAWSMAEIQAAHRAVAARTPAGSPRRLRHLLEGGAIDEMVDEAVRVTDALERSGRLAAACATAFEVLQRLPAGHHPRALYVSLARLALQEGRVDALDALSARLDAEVGAGGAGLRGLLAVERALRSGDGPGALALLADLPPLRDERLQQARERYLELVAERVVRGRADDAVARFAARSTAAFDTLMWKARAAYLRHDLAESARLNEAAAAVAPGDGERIRALLLAASRLLSAGDLDGCAALARQGREAAARRRLASQELRAEWLLRSARQKQGETEIAPDLIEAARAFPVATPEAALALMTEAYIAWQGGDLAACRSVAMQAGARFDTTGNAAGSRICAGLVCACDADAAGIAALLDPRDPVVSLDLLVLPAQHRALRPDEESLQARLRVRAHAAGWRHVGLFPLADGVG